MVHGRFQPFHNGHLAYARAAAARCARLVVGITAPDARHLRPEPDDPARHLPAANPFTYAERLEMVLGALTEAGLEERVRVVPFPIDAPALWPAYVPAGTVHFLRLQSTWSAAKVGRLRAHGQTVVVLDDPEGREVSGTAVRAALAAGRGWEALVPPAVARLLRADRA